MPNWHMEAIPPHDLDKTLTFDRSAFKKALAPKIIFRRIRLQQCNQYAVKKQSANYSMEIIASVFLRNQYP